MLPALSPDHMQIFLYTCFSFSESSPELNAMLKEKCVCLREQWNYGSFTILGNYIAIGGVFCFFPQQSFSRLVTEDCCFATLVLGWYQEHTLQSLPGNIFNLSFFFPKFYVYMSQLWP